MQPVEVLANCKGERERGERRGGRRRRMRKKRRRVRKRGKGGVSKRDERSESWRVGGWMEE